MTLKIGSSVLLGLILSAAGGAQEGLPNRTLTPGAAIAGVTAEQVCTVGYSRSVRNVPISEKREVFARYHVTYVPNTFEVDHLISLELGGSNAVENLWPEPLEGEWGAKAKDRLENRLHWMVCSGMLTLKQAQDYISQDWISAYRDIFAHSRRRRAR